MKSVKNLTLFSALIVVLGCQPTEEKSTSQTAFYDPPQWSKEVIWYQIFVERFRNGDPTNDPTPEDMKGTYPGFVPDDWKPTPWTQDWYSDDDYFPGLANGKDFYGNPVTAFGQKSQLRRYGGDLQGVLDQMDYMDSLGITAVYFNPLNDAPSLHKYDARHWRHIDRNFGPDPRGDVAIMESETPNDPLTWQFTAADNLFVKVIDEFHKRGIKVILDFSWNHTGHTFWAWKDVVENQTNSKYKDWYWVKSFETDTSEFEYRGWLGVFDLPEIKETVYMEHNEKVTPSEGDILLDEVKEHIFAVSRRWLDPNNDGDPSDGVDGFRLDVAAEVPYGFWRDYRKVVRDVNPDAYLLGEVWWEQWPDKLLDPEPFVRGDIFDAPMNYRWYRAARHFFNQSPTKIPVSEFADSLNSFRSNLRPQSNYAMMNLNGSHDTPRVLTSLFNKNAYKMHTNPYGENKYKIHKPDAETYETLKLLLVQQYTYIGSPHIWAGDEMGMWGSDDPSCRKPLIWPDYEFENETTHPEGWERPEDEVAFNYELFEYYRKLINIRKDNPVLMTGDIEFNLIIDESETLVYSRSDENETIFVAFNAGQSESVVGLTTASGEYQDLLKNLSIESLDDSIAFELPPRSAAIIKKVD